MGTEFNKDAIITLAGTIIGSLAEEIIEMIQSGDAGSPEYKFAGEAIGTIIGYLVTKTKIKKEIFDSLKVFSKYAYKVMYQNELEEQIDEELIDKFGNAFRELEKEKQEKIMNAFKLACPHEFELIFL